MKVSLWTIILPRLELPFLKEWLEHHLTIGFDTIYIYDNGFKPDEFNTEEVEGFLVKGGHFSGTVRELSKEEKEIKWPKKPDADYLLDSSDDEILTELDRIINFMNNRFGKNSVVLTRWRQGMEVHPPYPLSQAMGYKHCVENNHSDWWLTIDPDEYLVLHKHDSVKDFLSDISNNGKSFKTGISQKVFDERVVGKPVREIFNWAYELSMTKCFVREPFLQTSLNPKFENFDNDEDEWIHTFLNRKTVVMDIHDTLSYIGCDSKPFGFYRSLESRLKNFKVVQEPYWCYFEKPHRKVIAFFGNDEQWNSLVSEEIAVLHHYRGDPKKMGGQAHYKYFDTPFDKIDKTMEKYLNDNTNS